jgi:formylglycine-generating enzyme required for sulfatase activity
MGTDPSRTSSSSGTSDPAQYVNWFHAIAFCNKLSIAEGLTPAYSVSGITDWATVTFSSIPTSNNAAWDGLSVNWSASGYRLPTEMEWVWAAMGAPADGRSGGTNTTGYALAFAGSDGINNADDYSWNWYNSLNGSVRTTHPSGTKTANTLGLCDMSGNVCEWCYDSNAAYPSGEQTDYRGAASGTDRVIHGGSYASGSEYATVAYRLYPQIQYYRGSDIGFRVLRP